jgi:NADH-quinone oxidoreductase subunit G
LPEAPPTGGADATVTFTLDGRSVAARPGEMLIAAAERAGTYVPRFCYHPRMKSVGVCRMCLVEVVGPRGATLQPSCYIEVTEGMSVVTNSDKVKKAQDGVLEFLLVNHPLDCPVCDKGGECPLQDQTLAYGPGESRFVEEKRHFEKPIAISDLVLLDRERCIQCARCTRFAEEVAGEAQIDFAGRGERVEVATFPTQPFTSYFSGNTVQICPVGALTATPYRFTARPWDLDQVESTCTTCALGCRVAVQSSSNRLTRLLGIDSEPVNHGWLCDKGRFVFEAVNGDEMAAGPDADIGERVHADVVPATASQVKSAAVVRGQFLGEAHETGRFSHGRLHEPMVRKEGELVTASWGEALAAAAAGLTTAVSAGGPTAVGVIGGARLTNEAAYAWARFAKGVVGTDSVDAQLGDGLDATTLLALPRATIDDACRADAVVLLSGDVREELPVLFLRLREAAVDGTTALVEITPVPTSLTPYTRATVFARPGESPTAARAVTGDAAARAALGSHHAGAATPDEVLERAVAALAAAGPDGSGVVVVAGRPSLAESAAVTEAALRALHAALPGARFLPALRRGNVMGALDMGLSPGLLPGRVSLEEGRSWFAAAWGAVPGLPGRDTTGILGSLAGEDPAGPGTGRVRALVLLGADPLDDFADRALAERALAGADFVLAVAGHPSESITRADVVLPAAVVHERPGTTTNIEGRVSRLGQKILPPGYAWPDWMIAAELATYLGGDLQCASLTDLWAEIQGLAPAYHGLTQAVLDSDPAHDGILVPLDTADRARAFAHGVEPIDPVALPGVESVERQGAPPRVGLAEPPSYGDDAPVVAPPPGTAPAPAPLGLGALAAAGRGPTVPAPDGYALRLVAPRRLYDAGSAVTGSPSLTPLVGALRARANPYDLDRLGVTTGGQVRLRSPRADLVVEVSADPGVPRGTVAVPFNVPAAGDTGAANAVAALIDAGAVVNDVRVESV